MLYFLGQFGDQLSVLNVFRYITFRTARRDDHGDRLRLPASGRDHRGAPQSARARASRSANDGPQTHLVTKVGTPTMGGLMILSGLLVSTLLWANLSSAYVWIVLLVTLGFGLIGLYDDYLKVTKQTHKGFSGRAAPGDRIRHRRWSPALSSPRSGSAPLSTALTLPFFKDVHRQSRLVLRALRRLRRSSARATRST